MWVLLRIGIFYENLSEGGVDMSYIFGVLFPKTKQAEKVFLSSLFRSYKFFNHFFPDLVKVQR